jgi:hypothetical protein
LLLLSVIPAPRQASKLATFPSIGLIKAIVCRAG